MKHPPPPQKPDYSAVFARVFVGALFILSGFSKAAYPPEAFAASLEGYKLFPDWSMMPIAQTMPWIELFLGSWLLTGWSIKRVSLALTVLLGMFEAVLMAVITRNIDLANCGCYGAYGPHFTPTQASLFDAALIVMTLWTFANPKQPFSLDAWIDKGS